MCSERKKNRTTTTTRKLSLGHRRVSFKLSNIGVYKEATSRDVDRVHQKGIGERRDGIAANAKDIWSTASPGKKALMAEEKADPLSKETYD